ncbi:MAG TPA: hypothetical protein ENI38_00980 [Candidatus Acetothermia bacterium]|nr:hypothetical protein [Candidatus Acetothermia bacterium]
MKIFLDTASLEEIKELRGFIDGVTTNPTLVARKDRPFLELVGEICRLVEGPVSAEVTARDARGMVAQMLEIYRQYEFPAQVIVASVRHVRHVVEAALLGAPIVTVPYGVAKRLLDHPLTELGIERFLADWQGLPSEFRPW